MLSLLNDSDARSKLLLARLADQPKSPAIIGIAEVLCEQGRYSEAIVRLRSVAELYGDVYRFNLVLARACRDAGETKQAKQYYEKACQVAPQNEVAIKELIALTTFPHAIPKPLPQKPAMKSETVAMAPESKKLEPQVLELEVPSTFKLDREKISKILGVGMRQDEKSDAEKNDTTPLDTQKSSSAPTRTASVAEAFRKADELLEQEPDIDALAREVMGFSPQEPLNTADSVPQNVLADKTPVESTSTTESESQHPNILTHEQQRPEHEVDIDALARQMSGMSFSDSPPQSTAIEGSRGAAESTSPTQQVTSSASTSIPLDENANPRISIDRNKLSQALSGLHKAKGIMPSKTSTDEEDCEDSLQKLPSSSSSAPAEAPAFSSTSQPVSPSGALSFEEEIMSMQMQGVDINTFIANKETSRHDEVSAEPPPLHDDYDLDALAREMMNAQLPKIEETNDPTPISEQRQPFPDDEEIKTPTRQLAKIFQSQGAYAKAIKVYEMLAEREPENASLYEILIGALREKINAQ